MLIKGGIIVLCILWMLLCLRFYTLISRENVWQRRFIAIAAGLGAGLIYYLASMIVPLLQPEAEAQQPIVEQLEDIRVQGRE